MHISRSDVSSRRGEKKNKRSLANFTTTKLVSPVEPARGVVKSAAAVVPYSSVEDTPQRHSTVVKFGAVNNYTTGCGGQGCVVFATVQCGKRNALPLPI